MAELRYPGKKDVKGPWILSEALLLDLGEVLEKVKDLLDKSLGSEVAEVVMRENGYKELTDSEVKNRVKAAMQRSQFKNRKDEFIFELEKDTKLVDISMRGLLKHKEIQNYSPETLQIYIGRGRTNRLSFSVSDELEYELQCFDPDIDEEIKYELDKWISRAASNNAMKIWAKIGEGMLGIAGLILFFLILVVVTASHPKINRIDQYEETVLKPRAISLIEEGIDSTNLNEAVGLLLKGRYSIVPEDFKPAPSEATGNPKLIEFQENSKWILIFAFACAVGYFRPHRLLGIGKNSKRYIYYQWWFKFVTYTVPAIIVMAPFWDRLTAWLYS